MARHIALSSIIALFILFPMTVYAEDKVSPAVIEVTGHAVITAVPNLVSIVLSVENSDSRAENALRKNSDLTTKVIASLKKVSGKDTTISTSSFTILPMYDSDRDLSDKAVKLTPRSYRVENSVFLKTTRIDRLGAYIDAAVVAGSSRIGSVVFSRDDMDLLQKQAASKALENAMDIAKKLAKTAGLNIKRIKFIQYMPNNTESDSDGPAQTQTDDTIQEQTGPKELSFESYVSVTFELG